MTNSDRLQEIRERAEKATKGPWGIEVDQEWGDYGTLLSSCVVGVSSSEPREYDGEHQIIFKYDDDYGNDQVADAQFIAASREDIPWLLQHITEQQREIARARRTVSTLVGGMCENKEGCQYPQCKCGQPEEAKGYRKQETPM